MTLPTSRHNRKPTPTRRFVGALRRYSDALGELQHNPQVLLSVLLARDAVYQALAQDAAPLTHHVQALQEYDTLLEKLAITLPDQPLAEWRRSFAVNPTLWWWNLERATIDARSETQAAQR